MDVSGTSMASYAGDHMDSHIGAHPSSLRVNASEIGLENYMRVCAIVTATSVAWPTQAPRECAHGKWSFVFYRCFQATLLS